VGILFLLLGRQSKHSNWEDREGAVEHLKRLLDGNRMMPGLINILGILGSTILIAIGTFTIMNYMTLDYLLEVVVLECLLGLTVSIWLTRKMTEVWKDFQAGNKPRDYGDALGIIASASIQFNVLVSILFFTRMISSGEYSNIWLPIQLILASYSLLKDTIPV
jgi:hypothetical protein